MAGDGEVITLSKKVCLLGDFAVGKTGLARRFVYNYFEDRCSGTNGASGVKVSCKVVVVPKDDTLVELTLMLWDLSAGQQFDSGRVSYLRGAAGAVVVCDITRPPTIEGLYRYSQDLRAFNPEAHLILAFNKSDLTDQRALTAAQIAAVASDINAPYAVTSGKTGEHVDDIFRRLGRLLVADVARETPTGTSSSAPAPGAARSGRFG